MRPSRNGAWRRPRCDSMPNTAVVKKPLVLHPVARCRWCNAKFRLVWGCQWVCLSQLCRDRQMSYAVSRQGKTPRGESPILYLPTPAQVELHECRITNLLWGGAAGGSKSHGLRWGLYRNALTIPGYEALLLRRTFPELEKTHLRRMAREAEQLGATYLDGKRIMKFPNGSLIEAGHCETEDDAAKYLSSEYDEIAFDEATTFLPSVILEISSRARSSKPAVVARGGAFVRMGSNPGGVGALYLRDAYITKTPDPEEFPKYRPEDHAFIPARLRDNPYLDIDYVNRLEQLPDARQRQLRDGDWDVFEAQFFPEWRAERDGSPWHVQDCDGEAADMPLVGGVDWGYNQPGCFLWARLLPDGRLYVQADWKFQGLSVESVAAGVRRRTDELRAPRFRAIYCDPSMGNKTGFGQAGQTQAESHAEVFGRLGLPMIRSDNDRYHGWQRVHDYLRAAPDGRPWLVVSPRCRYGIRSLPTMVQDKHDADDLDTTADDHWVDALRYLLAGRPAPGRASKAKAADQYGTLAWYKAKDRKPRRTLTMGPRL